VRSIGHWNISCHSRPPFIHLFLLRQRKKARAF
jgi:hypothetical protein